MLVNEDFTRPAIVTPDAYRWIPSPMSGVERVMLDRVGGEVARATSIVRYAPGSSFPEHRHPAGEEILVLSGTFSDDGGDYPAGWYLRNPPGSGHRPASAEGTTIFVKLMQMARTETAGTRIDTRDPANWRREGNREVCRLFANGHEQVSLQRLVAGLPVAPDRAARTEILVLEGALLAEGRQYASGTWIRLPAGEDPGLLAGPRGALFYMKAGASDAVPRALREDGCSVSGADRT